MGLQRSLVAALSATLLLAANVAAVAPPATDGRAAAAAVLDRTSAVVVFRQQPLATYDGHVKGYEKTRPDHGKLNPNSAAVKKYLGYLKTEHANYAKWLAKNVPSARITSDFFVALNGVGVQLNGAGLGKLTSNSDVIVGEYNALYHPSLSESYKIIDATAAWSDAGGRADAGRGVKIGMIDAGIDENHPLLDDSGFWLPGSGGPWPKCDARDSDSATPDTDCRYTSNKVIVAKVFNNKLNQTGFDAEAVQDHGTHTSGIAAGIYGPAPGAVVNGVSIDDMSGVAPGAWLGNYNVFPGDVESARSEDILNAVDAAVFDGMDVLNLSLGGGYHGSNDLLAMALDNAVDAGVVVSVSAGNSGPGPGTVESPGRARKVITSGNSTNQHFVGQALSYDGTTIGAITEDFPILPDGTHDLFVTDNGASGLENACFNGIGADGPLPDASNSDELVLVTRGVCTFSEKDQNAKEAGYGGMIVVNTRAGDPVAMGLTDGFDNDLPADMVGKAEGLALAATDPGAITVDSDFAEFITPWADLLEELSSQGPSYVDLAVKPDLTSVGTNVLSSITCVGKEVPCGDDGTWAFFSGTSMSAAQISGSAAVLLGMHPDWDPWQVKSALVNTADLVVQDQWSGIHDVGPNQQGGGRENLSEASEATTFLAPVSASFGRIRVLAPTSLTITLYNPTESDQNFTLTEQKFTPSTFGDTIPSVYGAGTIATGDVRISTPANLTVPADGLASLTLTITGQGPGTVIQGWILLDGSGGSYQFAYYAVVGP